MMNEVLPHSAVVTCSKKTNQNLLNYSMLSEPAGIPPSFGPSMLSWRSTSQTTADRPPPLPPPQLKLSPAAIETYRAAQNSRKSRQALEQMKVRWIRRMGGAAEGGGGDQTDTDMEDGQRYGMKGR